MLLQHFVADILFVVVAVLSRINVPVSFLPVAESDVARDLLR